MFSDLLHLPFFLFSTFYSPVSASDLGNRTQTMVESTSNNATGDGSGANSALRAKISELERDLREERDRLIVEQSQAEVAKFVARQEVEKCRRDCSGLQDRVARLEEDCDTLREREAKGQERIKSLVEVIEAKERDFQEKFIEMKVEIRDLECGKNRAVAEVVEWRKRCEELAEENLRLKGGEMVVAGEVDEEMPLRNEGHLSTPERKRSSEFLGVGNESESMGEDGCDERIPLRQLRKRRVAEVSDGAGKDSGCGGPCEDGDAELAGTGNAEPVGTNGEVADPQIPSSPATGKEEDLEISRNSKSLLEVVENKHKLLTRNRSPRSKKKFQSFILRCSSTGRNSATSGCDSVAADQGLRSDLKSGRSSSNQKHERGYTGRVASSEQKDRALARAEELKGNLNNNHPSFVKPVTRSHVSTCFRLAFPPKFCEEVFSAHDHLKMVLEDEKGVEHQVKYIRARGALCGGWKGFASGQNLEIGDALVFELSEPTRFKVYVIKAPQESSTEVFISSKSAQEDGKTAQEDDKIAQEETDGVIKQADSKKSETDGVIKQADSKKSETDGVIKQADTKKSEKRVKPLRFRFVRRTPQKLDMQSKSEEQQE